MRLVLAGALVALTWHAVSLAFSLDDMGAKPFGVGSADASDLTRTGPTIPRRRPAGPAVAANVTRAGGASG